MIGQIMIHVTSLEKARSFYIDLLGLEIESDLSSELGMLIIKNKGCYFTLHEGFRSNPIDWNSCKTTIIISVSDVFEMRETLMKKGVELKGDVIDTPVHQYQTIKDFDGNWIEVAQFKHLSS